MGVFRASRRSRRLRRLRRLTCGRLRRRARIGDAEPHVRYERSGSVPDVAYARYVRTRRGRPDTGVVWPFRVHSGERRRHGPLRRRRRCGSDGQTTRARPVRYPHPRTYDATTVTTQVTK